MRLEIYMSLARADVVSGSSMFHSILKRRGVQLLLLSVAMAAGGYVRTAISPLQETMRVALSMSDNQMALLQGPLIGIPVVLASVPLGLLIDRYSRARLLFTLILLSFLGSLLTALAPSFMLLFVARGISGLVGLSTIPVSYSLLADLYPPSLRGRATTVICVGQLAGISSAFALGGALLTMKGHATEGWRWAMLWMSAPLGASVLLMFVLREPSRTGTAMCRPTARRVWEVVKHHRAVVVPLAVGAILVETAVGSILIWAAPMLARSFSLSPDRIGTVMALTALIGGTMGPIVGGALADLCQRTGGPRRTVIVLSALALLSAPTDLYALVSTRLSVSAMLVAGMILMQMIFVIAITLFTIVIPDEVRGLCTSMFVAINLLFVFAVAPVMVSVLSGALGGPMMIGQALTIICLSSSLLAASIFTIGSRNLDRIGKGAQ
jgi:predicted MFS family arabinose efflux permease